MPAQPVMRDGFEPESSGSVTAKSASSGPTRPHNRDKIESVSDKPDLVERRQQVHPAANRALNKAAVNVRFRGPASRGSGAGQPPRHAQAAGRVSTKSRTGRCSISANSREVSLNEWKLEVGGLVENPFTLTGTSSSRFRRSRTSAIFTA